jgi:hypothetical protein
MLIEGQRKQTYGFRMSTDSHSISWKVIAPKRRVRMSVVQNPQGVSKENGITLCHVPLANSTEHSPASETSGSSANQQIRRILRKPEVHHCFHNTPPLVRILSQISLRPPILLTEEAF